MWYVLFNVTTKLQLPLFYLKLCGKQLFGRLIVGFLFAYLTDYQWFSSVKTPVTACLLKSIIRVKNYQIPLLPTGMDASLTGSPNNYQC